MGSPLRMTFGRTDWAIPGLQIEHRELLTDLLDPTELSRTPLHWLQGAFLAEGAFDSVREGPVVHTSRVAQGCTIRIDDIRLTLLRDRRGVRVVHQDPSLIGPIELERLGRPRALPLREDSERLPSGPVVFLRADGLAIVLHPSRGQAPLFALIAGRFQYRLRPPAAMDLLSLATWTRARSEKPSNWAIRSLLRTESRAPLDPFIRLGMAWSTQGPESREGRIAVLHRMSRGEPEPRLELFRHWIADAEPTMLWLALFIAQHRARSLRESPPESHREAARARVDLDLAERGLSLLLEDDQARIPWLHQRGWQNALNELRDELVRLDSVREDRTDWESIAISEGMLAGLQAEERLALRRRPSWDPKSREGLRSAKRAESIQVVSMSQPMFARQDWFDDEES